MTIKQSPSDFIVEELLAPEVAAALGERAAAHAVYRLTKEGLTTPDAAATLARALGVRPGQVAYAGLKDRHARTIQHISVPTAGKADLPADAEGPGWRAERIGWTDAPLSADAIAANRFTIIVRDLSREACRRMDEAAAMLTLTPAPDARDLTVAARKSEMLFVNYFGDQRFGSARAGRGFLAAHLVRGEFEDALRLAIGVWGRKDSKRQKEFRRAVAEGWGRWAEILPRLSACPERAAVEHLAAHPDDFAGAFAALPYGFQELAVHAYQSHLWNATAQRLMTDRCPGAAITAADPFGEMVFPAAAGVPADLATLDLPVLGRDSILREPWKPAAESVLAAEGLTTDRLRIPDLRRPQFGEAPRPLFARATSFDMSQPQADETHPKRLRRTLSFDLPRGAYATVVLRALGE